MGRHDDRPVDQDRMRHHGVEKLVVGQGRIVEPELRVGRALLADHVAHRNAHPLDELPSRSRGRRRLQILDHVRLDAGVADQRQRVAGRAAVRVVVDDHVHGKARLRRRRGRRREVAPSGWPISRKRWPGRSGRGRPSAALETTKSGFQILGGLDEGRSFSISGTLDGGGILDAPVRGRGMPGQTGQASPAALSQTVKTKSIRERQAWRTRPSSSTGIRPSG